MIQPEFDFILPQGLLEQDGKLHRQGMMRLATGKDEFIVQGDRRSQEDSEYHILLMLSRVIVKLGNIAQVTPEILEQLFLQDLFYLKQLYLQLNQLTGDWLISGE
jgi:hypothetical protein